MISGPRIRGDQSGDRDTGGSAGYANAVVFGPDSEKKYVAPSGGPYVSLHCGDCEDRQHGAGLAGQAGVRRYQLDDLAQVKVFLRTCPWLSGCQAAKFSCGHVHIDGVRLVGAVGVHRRLCADGHGRPGQRHVPP